jgi:hypothetical protein
MAGRKIEDSINGAHILEYFAMTAAWVGDKDLACETLAKAEQLPGYGTITYGQLKLMPIRTRCAAIRSSRKSLILWLRSNLTHPITAPPATE